MTTFPFQPPPQSAFTFQPTLTGFDGATALYTGTVTWDLYGVRWFLNLFQLDGTRIFTRPLIESPGGRNLQALSWASGTVTATSINPHGWALDSVIPLTIDGCAPAGYNGAVSAYIVSPTSFAYQLGADPGTATTFGVASYDVNLAGGYFASSIVYRNGNLVVSP